MIFDQLILLVSLLGSFLICCTLCVNIYCVADWCAKQLTKDIKDTNKEKNRRRNYGRKPHK